MSGINSGEKATAGKSIVILGGGIGGLVAANDLRRLLPREHRVVLVEKNPQHAFAPSFLWLMVGDRRPEQIVRPVRSLASQGVEIVEAEARGIDLQNRRVETSSGPLSYDYLILALGAELAPEAIPGLNEAAHTYYTFDGATKLRDALREFKGGTVAGVVSALPYKCPGAPHEGAMLIADYLRRRGLGGKFEVHLFTPEPQPMPVAGPVLGEAVRQMLQQRAVAFHPSHKLAFDGGEPFGYDLLVAIPPHRASALVREAGLANEAGWVPVDRNTLATAHPNVYAIGDITAVGIPGRWKPDVPMMLPKAGVFAHSQALVVSRRIAAEITGAQTSEGFCGGGYCMLEAGEKAAGIAFGNFYAEPSPEVKVRRIGKLWHVGKVLFERWWLAPIGLRRTALGAALKAGGKMLGIPVEL